MWSGVPTPLLAVSALAVSPADRRPQWGSVCAWVAGWNQVGPFGCWPSPEPGLAVARRVWVSDPAKDTQQPCGQGIRVSHHTDWKIKHPQQAQRLPRAPSNHDISNTCGQALCSHVSSEGWHGI
uniref:Uncharacterized protein n=1 Tax=Pipistrellus kuhlii TaxID=59472 RepID=A0A7J7WZZ3_PIPKU|nr:hypothetical protein mPipKuh1_010720 [Pipistrellus kuhlii]